MTQEEKEDLIILLRKNISSKRKATKLAKKRDDEVNRILLLPLPLIAQIILIIRKTLDDALKGIDKEDFDELDKEISSYIKRKRFYELQRSVTEAQNKKVATADAIVRASALATAILSKKLGIGHIWITVRDDRVCPICHELDGKKTVKLPPAHPNCRCTIRPI